MEKQVSTKIRNNLTAAFVLRHHNSTIELLLLKRSLKCKFTPNVFQILYGHAHKWEALHQTIVRELKEETGLVPIRLINLNETMIFYDHGSESINIVPVFVIFVDEEAKVVIDGKENTDFLWVEASSARSMLPFTAQRRAWDAVNEAVLRISIFSSLDYWNLEIKENVK